MYKITQDVVISTDRGAYLDYSLYKKCKDGVYWEYQDSSEDKKELIKGIKMQQSLEPTQYYNEQGEQVDA